MYVRKISCAQQQGGDEAQEGGALVLDLSSSSSRVRLQLKTMRGMTVREETMPQALAQPWNSASNNGHESRHGLQVEAAGRRNPAAPLLRTFGPPP